MVHKDQHLVLFLSARSISLNRFLKKTTDKNYPSNGNASLCGVIVDADDNSGLANRAESFIFSGDTT